MRARARAKNLQRMYKNVILSSVSSCIHLSPLSNLCLVGSLMLPVRFSITRVFVTMPSQKTPSGMIASPTQPNNPPPPFSFIVFFFILFSSRNEMRRIRRQRRSTECCISSRAPLENTGAAGSFGDNQGLMGGASLSPPNLPGQNFGFQLIRLFEENRVWAKRLRHRNS